jgi:glycosyltransferase involved in cell wall biosynthesis
MSPKRMKCMLFSHICTTTHITGAEKLLLFYAQELQAIHDCILVVPNEGVLSHVARTRGLYVIVLPYPVLWEIYTPINSIKKVFLNLTHSSSALAPLMKLLYIHHPDLIVSNSCVNVLPPFAAKALGIPVIWMITETIVRNKYTGVSVRLIKQFADWIIGISQSTLHLFRGANTFILYPSWRMEELEQANWEAYRRIKRTELGITDNERIIGYISSNIFPLKGLDHFILMAQKLSQSLLHVKFLIVGTPSDYKFYEECKQMVRDSPNTDRFHFVPFTVQTQRIYPAMDVIVIPSLVPEGFGMAALEGHIFGKPVVSYASGGLEEIMRLMHNDAYLVPTQNWEYMEQVVSGLLNDEEKLYGSGKRNFEVVQEVFGLNVYRERLYEIMRVVQRDFDLFQSKVSRSRMKLLHLKGVIIRKSHRSVYLLSQGVCYPLRNYKWLCKKYKHLRRVITLPKDLIASLKRGRILGVARRSINSKYRGEAFKHRVKR